MTDRIPPLGEDPKADLRDFCAAHYGAPRARVVADALAKFIRARLEADPALRARFDEARRKRLKIGAEIIPLRRHLRSVK